MGTNRTTRFVFAVTLLCVAAVCSSNPALQGSNLVTYPDSEKGLKTLIDDLLRAAASGDDARFISLTAQMKLPNHSEWFTKVFGDSPGEEIASSYSSFQGEIRDLLYPSFVRLQKDGYKGIQVQRHERGCKGSVSDAHFRVLSSRKTDVPLYTVLAVKGNQSRSVGLFAFVDGAFRWLGNIRFNPPRLKPPSEGGPHPVDARVQNDKLLKASPPIYPPGAKEARIQGTVRLSGIIARDGSVQDLRYEAGECLLVEAAMTAVRQWRYRPTLLNAQPVEVATTIEIVFRITDREIVTLPLSRRP